VRRVIREGCVGETVAAVEAGEAGASAADPVVRSILEAIASDEATHAELAWRTVRFVLATFGEEARGVVEDEILLLRSELARTAPRARSLRDEVLLGHGVVTETVRASIRRATLECVSLPCLEALVRTADRGDAASALPLSLG